MKWNWIWHKSTSYQHLKVLKNSFLDHNDDIKEDICGSSKKIQLGIIITTSNSHFIFHGPKSSNSPISLSFWCLKSVKSLSVVILFHTMQKNVYINFVLQKYFVVLLSARKENYGNTTTKSTSHMLNCFFGKKFMFPFESKIEMS